MAVYYEILDIKIEAQELSFEDVMNLLHQDVITLVTLVKRSTDIEASPLISHPDFEKDLANTIVTSPSKKRVVFLEKLEDVKYDEVSNFTSLSKKTVASNQRKEEMTVILTQDTKTLQGIMLDRREPDRLRVIARGMGIKVGQSVDIFIVTQGARQTLKGVVKSFVERADRRKKGTFFCIYEIALSGAILKRA